MHKLTQIIEEFLEQVINYQSFKKDSNIDVVSCIFKQHNLQVLSSDVKELIRNDGTLYPYEKGAPSLGKHR